MAYEMKDGQGSLFVNKQKTEDKHPDRQGSIKLVCPGCKRGTIYRLSGWLRDLKDGSGKWMSLSGQVDRRQGGGNGDPEF